ncbi:phosphate regulon transcriptional regulator PhoB [Pseudorhodoferax sp. LjRoot39]|uniref:phosphate regulon transcriptional regulator PhoB n=1 Tax=Pseudorhodoferax sp. LjRoot39 TaxID=3342328 RepID=UPI003ED10D97
MARILIVDDEPAIVELISVTLRREGFDISIARDAEEASSSVDAALPDLVLLDWMLPNGTGIGLTRAWRNERRTREMPIIIISARAEEADRVKGLDVGADDYLTKPFSLAELRARIRSVLRGRSPDLLDSEVTVGKLTLNASTRRVHCGDTEVTMGPTEFRLLQFFMRNPERVHSRQALLDRCWGDHVYIEERTVDVHVKRLRTSLELVDCHTLIQTVRGAGYRFSAQSP